MKKFLTLGTFVVGLFFQESYAQDSSQQSRLSEVLTQYYSIKDALVKGVSNKASFTSEQFIKTLNAIDYRIISEGNINALLKDATAISESKDIKKQRDLFANLSANMVTLSKDVRLSSQPIYVDYCPMKKASWLSNGKEIRNPYYGSTMLTCGNIVDTIQ